MTLILKKIASKFGYVLFPTKVNTRKKQMTALLVQETGFEGPRRKFIKQGRAS